VAASLLLVGALLTPAVVLAQRSNGGGGNGGAMGRGTGGGRPAVGQQSFGGQWSPNHHHGFVGRPFFRPFVRPLFPFPVATAAVSAAVLRAAGRLIVGRPGRATPEPALSLDRHGGRRALDGSDRRGSREVPRGREAIPALLR